MNKKFNNNFGLLNMVSDMKKEKRNKGSFFQSTNTISPETESKTISG